MQRTRRALVLAPAAALLARPALAQPDYPNRPIHLVIPFGTGTGIDAIGRVFAQKMSAELGQTVVVENKAGAAGMIGAEFVAKSPPDGYTLFLSSGSVFAMNPILYSKVPYDGLKSFAPVSFVYAQPLVVATSLKMPPRSLAELLALAKSKPGGITAGVVGSFHQLSLQYFSNVTGTKYLPVPYKGGMMIPLLAGEIDMMIDVISVVAQQAKAGKIRALAVTSDKRMAVLPDVPTMQELGYPGFEMSTWSSLMGPANLPAAIVDKLNAAARKAIATPEFQELGSAQGLAVKASTPEVVTDLIRQETERWQKVAKDAGVKPE